MASDIKLNQLRISRRTPVRLTAGALVKTGYLDPQKKLPLVVQPAISNVNLAAWAAANLDLIESELIKHGALLFRGFDIDSIAAFDEFVRAVSEEMLDYSEPSSPRTEVARQIYTSTDYPASEWIQMHNELSYAHEWPRKVFFYCVQPAEQGGATPIAHGREVWRLLAPKIKERFREKQVMYVRNFRPGLDLPWQHVFNTTSRLAVEEYCRRSGIACEWLGKDRLRTRQIRQAVIDHPVTKDTVWFNQAHAFHAASLDPVVREALLAEMDEEDLPRQAYYGDGSAIEDSVIAEICEAYARASVIFQWQKGDLLLLENMLTAHGRTPFAGLRQILVAMSELVSGKDVIEEAGVQRC